MRDLSGPVVEAQTSRTHDSGVINHYAYAWLASHDSFIFDEILQVGAGRRASDQLLHRSVLRWRIYSRRAVRIKLVPLKMRATNHQPCQGRYTGEQSGVQGRYTGEQSGVQGRYTGEQSGVQGRYTGGQSGVQGRYTGGQSGVQGRYTGGQSGVQGRYTGGQSGVQGRYTGEQSLVQEDTQVGSQGSSCFCRQNPSLWLYLP